ncbi:MAG: glycine cleavage system protein GcvH [Candidatus Eremiobacteraeota bacterium]|nr:glycine cleavage system protein GcvH [Candidatus Eremiobacteraeota bacterium]
MPLPQDLHYSNEHEWVKLDGDVATVGITDYAQNSLGDIVYVELPKVGAMVTQAGNVGVIESVKAVSELFTPVGGEITEINGALDADPSVLNREPYTDGWLFKVKGVDAAQLSSLLDATAYEKLTAE